MDAAARTAFADFARGAGDLWFDCHFLPAELPAHRGWGHSSWQEALETACPGTMDAFDESFFADADAAYLRSLGINLIRFD